jgi:broad-specificity NMP kinase
LDAEIFEVLLEEAKASYDEEIVIELTSENDGDIESNCDRIAAWVKSWKESHSETAG